MLGGGREQAISDSGSKPGKISSAVPMNDERRFLDLECIYEIRLGCFQIDFYVKRAT